MEKIHRELKLPDGAHPLLLEGTACGPAHQHCPPASGPSFGAASLVLGWGVAGVEQLCWVFHAMSRPGQKLVPQSKVEAVAKG